MKQSDINRNVVLATLKKMPRVFFTRDLSEHADMLRGHASSGDTNYHGMIGRYLSADVSEVRLVQRGKKRGASWENLGPHSDGAVSHAAPAKAHTSRQAQGRPAVATNADPFGIGPQYQGDDAFARRMRRHQSWYRSHILKLRFGTGPQRSSTNPYGNMLTALDGAAGKNFLTPEIFAVARRRLAQDSGAVEPFRLEHNMLSSQPMCFNLFGPLVDDLKLATTLVRAVWGEHIKRVTRVQVEWAPQPKQEYLDDKTAFDAFIEYELVKGGKGFVGIETKLSESFSKKHVDKPSYRRWMTAASPWRPDASDQVDRVVHNQLWRDHLLAWSLQTHPRSPYEEGSLAVVYHPEDRRCAQVLVGYRALLSDERTLRDLPLDEIVAVWRRTLGPGSWLDEFKLRYLDLERSEAPMASPSRPRTTDAATGSAVRKGHVRALEQLEAEGYKQTLELYRDVPGGIEVYLRITDGGFTVLSLDAENCASMIGVGGRGTKAYSIRRLPPDRPSVCSAVEGYIQKRDSLARPSGEEVYSLELIRGALRSGLRLPRDGSFFISQEWRLPSGARVDLLGVNPETGRLVVVELKKSEAEARQADSSKGGDAWEQASSYAQELHEHRGELYPFFQRLARALAEHHGGPDSMKRFTLNPDLEPETCVSWPGGGFV